MAVLTVNQIIDNIDSFIANVEKLSKSYYLFVGKPNSWLNSNNQPDDTNVPAANASVEQAELSLYRDLVYGKLIFNDSISYMIPYTPWTSNTVYTQYSQYDPNLINENCYVVTSAREVYKCIFNNGNSASTTKPSLNTPSGTFKTADGYIWKYMYTIDPAADAKFTTASYVPVTVNANVESNAVPGTIDYIQLTNPGYNYQVYEEGFLSGVTAAGSVVVLPNTSNQTDDYYTGSSIYLKAGGGAGQIRNITQYTGLNRLARVDTPFNTFVNMDLSGISGTFNVGDTVSQNLVFISHYYDQGYFNAGNNIIQSDTGAAGQIVTGNSSQFVVLHNQTTNNFAQGYPFYNIAADAVSNLVLSHGTVTITANSNTVTGVANTTFTPDYTVGNYILVGNTTSNFSIRRITSITNTTFLSVDSPFTSNLVANSHYLVPSASEAVSVSATPRTGIVSFSNLGGVNINISNTTPAGQLFQPGEQVVQVDVNNVSQGANAIVSFSNSSTLQLTSVNGVLTANLYVLGQSSNVKAQIAAVTSYPNITITNANGVFDVGLPVFSSSSGKATLISYNTIPNSLTEYIISPQVSITGDGNGALAYARVDLSGANPNRQISELVLINHGQNYTQANVVITSNGQYGTGAAAVTSISPANGHGSNTYMELGAKYAGISVTFSNAATESYAFPTSGNFRRVGVLESPTFNDAVINLTSFDRVKLYLGSNNGTAFTSGEVVYQPNTNASGIVVFSNSTYLELKNVLGTGSGLPFYTYATNNANTTVIGLSSNAHANVLTTAANNTANSSVIYFQLFSNVETVSDTSTGASARITQVLSNTQIRVSSIQGHVNGNDYIYDAVTNAYARIASIYIANGSVDSTANFGHSFNQTYRIPLTSNTGTFAQFEQVTQQYTNATGTILSFNYDFDIALTANGTLTVGDVLTDSNTSATAVVLHSNGTYVRCTARSGTFSAGHTVVNQVNVGGTVSNVYPALVLYNAYGTFSTSSNNALVGASSNATGLTTIANTMTYPDLVRGSGATSYLENILPFTRSNTSSEKINIVIKF